MILITGRPSREMEIKVPTAFPICNMFYGHITIGRKMLNYTEFDILSYGPIWGILFLIH